MTPHDQPPPLPRTLSATERTAEIARRLEAGQSVAFIARALTCARLTVRMVRDDPEMQTRIASACKTREATHAEALATARQLMLEATPQVAQAFIDALDHADPRVRLQAAKEIADRIGLPRTERLESSTAPVDLSKLTTEEVEQLAALTTKIGSP
jgi:hypothetical protein